MKFKHLLLPVMAIVPAMSFAATYYVTPDGAGSKDGSNWENAFGVEELISQAGDVATGDVFNLGGGVYKPSATIVFKVGVGFTLVGGADGNGRTIFSGDKNDNNEADMGDAARLVRIQTNTVHGNDAQKTVLKDIDFTCVRTSVNNSDETNPQTTAVTMGALMIDNSGDVTVEGCRFYNNLAVGNLGGAAVQLYRSTVLFKGCEFYDNKANNRGGAIRMRSNANTKGYTTFDACVIKNNEVVDNLGGAIFMAHGVELNIVNSTIAENSASSDGAAIYVNGSGDHKNQLRIIGSTIAGNIITGENTGAEIASTQSADIKVVNSIIVGGNDNTGSFSFSGTVESDKFSFVSGGWNYVGPVIDAVAEPAKTLGWKEGAAKNGGDQYGENCTYGTVFGDHTVGSNGVIKPFYFEYGASGAQTVAAVADWGISAVVDYNVDQLGNVRVEGRMNGAFADPDINTGIGDVTVSGNDVKLVVAGNGVYCVEGHDGVVEAYNITGRRVAVTRENVISLENMSAGMYVIKAGNAVFKVVKR